MDKWISIDAELRAGAAGDSQMTIRGKALTYNAMSKPNVPAVGYRERIAPGCFRDDLASGRDVVALINHDPSQILGRTSNGTLTLTDGDDALRFEIRLNPNVQAHRDLHALVKDGTLHECSFAFKADEDAWDEQNKVRTVKRGTIFDCSIVTTPAYNATDAQARQQVTLGPQGEPIIAPEAQQALEEHRIAEEHAELVERYEKVRLF